MIVLFFFVLVLFRVIEGVCREVCFLDFRWVCVVNFVWVFFGLFSLD